MASLMCCHFTFGPQTWKNEWNKLVFFRINVNSLIESSSLASHHISLSQSRNLSLSLYLSPSDLKRRYSFIVQLLHKTYETSSFTVLRSCWTDVLHVEFTSLYVSSDNVLSSRKHSFTLQMEVVWYLTTDTVSRGSSGSQADTQIHSMNSQAKRSDLSKKIMEHALAVHEFLVGST